MCLQTSHSTRQKLSAAVLCSSKPTISCADLHTFKSYSRLRKNFKPWEAPALIHEIFWSNKTSRQSRQDSSLGVTAYDRRQWAGSLFPLEHCRLWLSKDAGMIRSRIFLFNKVCTPRCSMKHFRVIIFREASVALFTVLCYSTIFVGLNRRIFNLTHYHSFWRWSCFMRFYNSRAYNVFHYLLIWILSYPIRDNRLTCAYLECVEKKAQKCIRQV